MTEASHIEQIRALESEGLSTSDAQAVLEAQELAVIRPRTITILSQSSHSSRRTYVLAADAAKYSDAALLSYCGYTPYFGGRVERSADAVRVTVHTD